MTGRLEVFAVEGIGQIARGDDLGAVVFEAIRRQHAALCDGDVVAIAQKAVSKSEGTVVDLATVEPSEFARRFAGAAAKDPRVVEVVLRESVRIVRMDRGVIISETRHGLICANAGVDASNASTEGQVTLLPEDPDASASRIRRSINKLAGVDVAVIVSDSFGRPWREGSVNVAIGVAGMAALDDLRGRVDDRGRVLRTSIVAVADELASAAQLVIGEMGGTPAAVIRGFAWKRADTGAALLRRVPEKDLFR
ncbi:MAG: coenzyme F420-0:L-glutamate ligase [Chloroflexi bacterium]|nr:coenzyme F420-0:L-glutamate ligase [Chloroflexota bacterium]